MNNIVYITLPNPPSSIGGGFLDDEALASLRRDTAAPAAAGSDN